MLDIETILAEFKQRGGFFMPPAGDEELAEVICSWIPKEYKQMLSITNGLIFSGMRLLGTQPIPLAGGHLEHDIFWATQDAKRSDLFSGGLALGHMTGNLLIAYNEETETYQILDKSCGDVVYEFESLVELLNDWFEKRKHLTEPPE